uniref:Ovule protein n=1 Tax=Steinernema glaseri TaxID=37863 RepID=A0A1I7YWP9_9BILA
MSVTDLLGMECQNMRNTVWTFHVWCNSCTLKRNTRHLDIYLKNVGLTCIFISYRKSLSMEESYHSQESDLLSETQSYHHTIKSHSQVVHHASADDCST